MIDNNELISTLRERAALYAYGSADSMVCTAAANSLEAQAREIEHWKAARESAMFAGEQMQAELAAIKAQEPVLVVEKEPDYWSNGHYHQGRKSYVDRNKVSGLLVGTKLFAAPVAPAQPVNAELVAAVQANHDWHQLYDDHGGYPGSDLEEQNITALANAKAAPVRGVPDGWMPMDTAPKNFKRILLEIEGVDRPVLGFWNGLNWATIDANDWSGRSILRWHELPRLPAAPRQEQKGGAL